jgi:nicotinate-nucleotide pyrophosphorylase (carboxylating)
MDWKSRRITALLEAALNEDKAAQDMTSALTIDPGLRATGTVVAHQACIVAGLGCIPAVLTLFHKMAARPASSATRFAVVSHPEVFDGVRIRKGQTIAVIRANASTILATERVILNLLQRMSGIATLTGEYVKAVAGTKLSAKTGVKTRIVDTRKTIPGFRALDKYAVSTGGGTNHRLDLQDGILLKHNHYLLGGGLPQVLERALAGRKAGQIVQAEAHTFAELDQALAGRAESILLDNMSPSQVKKAVKLIRRSLPKTTIEAAGNITLKSVRDYAKAGVDFVSIGALTNSATAVDLSMRITRDAS